MFLSRLRFLRLFEKEQVDEISSQSPGVSIWLYDKSRIFMFLKGEIWAKYLHTKLSTLSVLRRVSALSLAPKILRFSLRNSHLIIFACSHSPKLMCSKFCKLLTPLMVRYLHSLRTISLLIAVIITFLIHTLSAFSTN